MKAKMNPYYVEFNQECTYREESQEQYDSWGESYSNSFESITNKTNHPNLVSSLKFKKGEKAFLVWIEYSTGDSFGRSDRGHVLPMGLFKDLASAEAFKAEAKFWTPEHDPTNIVSSRQCRFHSPDGQVITYHYPEWDDYFGGLDSVNIEEVLIK